MIINYGFKEFKAINNAGGQNISFEKATKMNDKENSEKVVY